MEKSMADEAGQRGEGTAAGTDGEEMDAAAAQVRELVKEIEPRRMKERKLEKVLRELATAAGAGDEELDGIAGKVKTALAQGREDLAIAEEMLVGSRFRELVAEHGVVDADAAGRLMDMSGVRVDLANRKVEGLEEAMDELVKARPYLVGRPMKGGTPGGGTPRTRGGANDEETLAGRVRQAFAKRLPSGMGTPGGGSGGMRIR